MLPLLLVAAALLSLVGAQCPDGAYYDSSFQKCYQLMNTPTDFLTAEFNCRSIGGHLVTVGSGFENSYLSGLAKGQDKTWIGYSYLQKTQWSWTSGSNSTFSNFASGQPADPSVYQCASLRSTGNTWLMEMCSANRQYICDVSPNATVTPSCPSQAPPTTGYCSPGYTLFPGNNLCYKYNVTFVSTTADAAECRAEGATLVKIDSAELNEFLLNLVYTTYANHYAPIIGLSCSSNSTADCYWFDGTPLTGFLNFWPGEPGGFFGGGNVTMMAIGAYHGTWITMSSSNSNLATLCQKNSMTAPEYMEALRSRQRAVQDFGDAVETNGAGQSRI